MQRSFYTVRPPEPRETEVSNPVKTSIRENGRSEGIITQTQRKPGRPGVPHLFPDSGTSDSNPMLLMVEMGVRLARVVGLLSCMLSGVVSR